MKQSDTLCSLILIPLTLPSLFCHLLSQTCGADGNGVCLLLFHFFISRSGFQSLLPVTILCCVLLFFVVAVLISVCVRVLVCVRVRM